MVLINIYVLHCVGSYIYEKHLKLLTQCKTYTSLKLGQAIISTFWYFLWRK